MSNIALELSKGLKEGKWISIEYNNVRQKRNTFFWIAILDVTPFTRLLKVDMFNLEKGMEAIGGSIYFDQIVSAQVIEGTTYEPSIELLERIRSKFSDYSFLEFIGVNDRILEYYQDCYYHDKDASVKQYMMLEGIDEENALLDSFDLSEDMFQQVVKDLSKYLRLRNTLQKQQLLKLAMNVLSIASSNVLFPIVYRDLALDIKHKKLKLSTILSFNTSITLGTHQINLIHYLDCSINEFIDQFEANREYYTQEIRTSLKKRELLDERPYVFEVKKLIGINIEAEYKVLHQHYLAGTMNAPCKAFFGMMDKEKRRKKQYPMMVANQMVNIDQYRVIHNAMNKDIVYVQGPPGTGKTATIVNTVLSCLMNRFSTLVVSNNNEAINNIYRKLQLFSYRNTTIHLPMLRLGSNEYITHSLNEFQRVQSYLSSTMPLELSERLKNLEEIIIGLFEGINAMIQEYDVHHEVEEQLESLQEIIAKMDANEDIDPTSKGLAIAGILAQIQNSRLQHQTKDIPYTPVEVEESLIHEYLFYLSYHYHTRLHHKKNKELYDILLMRNQKDRDKEFKGLLKSEVGLAMVTDCFPVILSTNLSVTKFYGERAMFDLLIMDEASQCNNAVALLPMLRCKRALFVGDQNQLQPVVVLNTIKNEELIRVYDIPVAYDYKSNSMLSTLLSIDTISKFILLRDHYRCHRKIIQFSNQKYYGSELRIKTKLDSVDALKLIDVRSSENEKNISREEIEAIVEEIKRTPTKDIAVITPFRSQANRLSYELEQKGLSYVKVGTIHTFQGDEKETIIISSGISKSSKKTTFDWVKNNQELINVATTRAKRKLVLVCDTQKIKELSVGETNDFYELMEYVHANGDYEVNYKENALFQSKVKEFKYYNSAAEEEFLKTLLHFKSVYQSFQIQTKVKVSDVLTMDARDGGLFQYGNQAHFDVVLYDLNRKPLLVIEVIGSEHWSDLKVMERDAKKKQICETRGIKLLTIRNDYVRRYHFIKQSILDALA